jgi:O-antigen ligase
MASYLILLPLFFTIFGKELGLTENMKFLEGYGERQIGIFTNPNTTGLHANYVLCFSLYSIISNRKYKFIWLLIVPCCCYAVFLSLSKAAILMTVLILLFYSLFIFFSFRKISLSGKLIYFIFVGLLVFSSNYLYQNFEIILGNLSYFQKGRILEAIQLGQGEINDQTTTERSGIAKLVFPKIIAHPFIGNGFGSFHQIKEHGLGVHNTVLLVLGESGVLPILIFLIFLLIFFKKTLSQEDIALKFLFFSLMSTYLMIAFLTSHNGLDERISNCILGIIIPSVILLNKDGKFLIPVQP